MHSFSSGTGEWNLQSKKKKSNKQRQSFSFLRNAIQMEMAMASPIYNCVQLNACLIVNAEKKELTAVEEGKSPTMS